MTLQELQEKRVSAIRQINNPATNPGVKAALEKALANIDRQIMEAGGSVPANMQPAEQDHTEFFKLILDSIANETELSSVQHIDRVRAGWDKLTADHVRLLEEATARRIQELKVDKKTGSENIKRTALQEIKKAKSLPALQKVYNAANQANNSGKLSDDHWDEVQEVHAKRLDELVAKDKPKEKKAPKAKAAASNGVGIKNAADLEEIRRETDHYIRKDEMSLEEVGYLQQQHLEGTHKNSKYKRVLTVGAFDDKVAGFPIHFTDNGKKRFETANADILVVLEYLDKIYNPSKKTPKAKTPSAPAPAPKAETKAESETKAKGKAKAEGKTYEWEGYDVEKCDAYIKKRNLEKREAKLEAFKAAALAGGADPEVVANMTFKDMVKKKSVHEQATERASGIVALQVNNHVKKADLKVDKDHSDELRTKREKLEAAAAEQIAVFAREKAKEVASELKEFAEKLRASEEKESK